MRRVYVLLISLSVGCSGSSGSPSGEGAVRQVDVSIPAPPAGPDRIERRSPVGNSSSDLSGTWRFVHGGEPWFVARIQQRGSRWTADLQFVEEVSWVRFVIARMEVPPRGSGRRIVLVGVDDGNEEREITLRLHESGLRLEGSVNGASYTEPFTVVATRIR